MFFLTKLFVIRWAIRFRFISIAFHSVAFLSWLTAQRKERKKTKQKELYDIYFYSILLLLLSLSKPLLYLPNYCNCLLCHCVLLNVPLFHSIAYHGARVRVWQPWPRQAACFAAAVCPSPMRTQLKRVTWSSNNLKSFSIIAVSM